MTIRAAHTAAMRSALFSAGNPNAETVTFRQSDSAASADGLYAIIDREHDVSEREEHVQNVRRRKARICLCPADIDLIENRDGTFGRVIDENGDDWTLTELISRTPSCYQFRAALGKLTTLGRSRVEWQA